MAVLPGDAVLTLLRNALNAAESRSATYCSAGAGRSAEKQSFIVS